MTSESGAGPKFIGTDIDPTGGEWEKAKVMEIWLDTQNPLTEPKWARGNLRDNIDPTSLFQNIIQVADPSGVTQQVHPPFTPPLIHVEMVLRQGNVVCGDPRHMA